MYDRKKKKNRGWERHREEKKKRLESPIKTQIYTYIYIYIYVHTRTTHRVLQPKNCCSHLRIKLSSFFSLRFYGFQWCDGALNSRTKNGAVRSHQCGKGKKKNALGPTPHKHSCCETQLTTTLCFASYDPQEEAVQWKSTVPIILLLFSFFQGRRKQRTQWSSALVELFAQSIEDGGKKKWHLTFSKTPFFPSVFELFEMFFTLVGANNWKGCSGYSFLRAKKKKNSNTNRTHQSCAAYKKKKERKGNTKNKKERTMIVKKTKRENGGKTTASPRG